VAEYYDPVGITELLSCLLPQHRPGLPVNPLFSCWSAAKVVELFVAILIVLFGMEYPLRYAVVNLLRGQLESYLRGQMILRRSPCVPVFEHTFELRPHPTARPYLQYPTVAQERLCRHWTNLMHTCHQQITTFL